MSSSTSVLFLILVTTKLFQIAFPQKSGKSVRGLYIATGQYSSLCVSAVVVTLSGDDIVEVDVPDREQVDCEGEMVQVRDKEKGHKTRTNNARSNM